MIRNISQSFTSQIATKGKGPTEATATKMANSFGEMFDAVNKEQLQADHMISEMVAGRNKDIPGTMVSMEKAETSLKMLMAVRSKMVAAYEEVMRMQM